MLKKLLIILFVMAPLLFFTIRKIDNLSATGGFSKPTPTPNLIILNSDKLLEIIQNWRTSKNLPKYLKSDSLCKIAQTRWGEIQKDWSHKGFSANRFCNSECEIAENIAPNMGSEKLTLDGWLNSPEHLKNLEYNYLYTCLVADQNGAVQIFSNF